MSNLNLVRTMLLMYCIVFNSKAFSLNKPVTTTNKNLSQSQTLEQQKNDTNNFL